MKIIAGEGEKEKKKPLSVFVSYYGSKETSVNAVEKMNKNNFKTIMKTIIVLRYQTHAKV